MLFCLHNLDQHTRLGCDHKKTLFLGDKKTISVVIHVILASLPIFFYKFQCKLISESRFFIFQKDTHFYTLSNTLIAEISLQYKLYGILALTMQNLLNVKNISFYYLSLSITFDMVIKQFFTDFVVLLDNLFSSIDFGKWNYNNPIYCASKKVLKFVVFLFFFKYLFRFFNFF